MLACAVAIAIATIAAASAMAQAPTRGKGAAPAPRSKPAAAAPAVVDVDSPDYLTSRARVAWRFAERYVKPETGLVSAVPFYDYATVWDIGSSLAMFYCARELGFIDEAHYKTTVRNALGTLAKLPLFDDAAYNKAYKVSTGTMIDRQRRASAAGYGWSVTDIGRLLIWLRIIANRDADLSADASAVVKRLDFSRLVKDGYLSGSEIGPDGKKHVYPEGQLGYEQYAAQGFALWSVRAEKALRLSENEVPVEVMGQTVAADKRQGDRLTSEPFVLAGLEFGWTPEMERLARAVLAAQEERARRTGITTMVSEDAVDVPPYYFYYYCVLANGREFSLDVQNPRARIDRPRWVSTKAAFGWHALLPSAYTRRALQTVEHAKTANGWSSGVFEKTTRSTGTLNVNTAAVIMTAAVYAQRGGPLIARDRTTPTIYEPH